MAVCPGCGQENPDVARFCFACATPLGSDVVEERKVVTVLFADLVGFTSRAEQMDPEDVRALLAPYHRRLRSELERHGGTVEKFIGDAVVALFGAPVAHEDDPERAVRAALAIRDWVREEGEDLQLRIAVNTGEALIALGARPEAGEGMASGDVVNTAARLQSAAPVNGILVGETTWRATRDRIDYAEHEPVTAKGKNEPIPVWEPTQAKARFGMDLEQRVLTPLVGRERELAVVLDAFERSRSEHEPQFVTLVGVPGIGKSRLVAELFQRIGEIPELVWWRQGRALPYGSGVSFWALGEIVKAQAGINENDAEEEALEKLSASVEQVVDDHDRQWVRRHLEALLGLGDEAAALDREQSFAAWRRYLEGLAEQNPLVLVFEDLHWADDGLLDFVDYLAEWAGAFPLLVLGTARPELLDRRPGWGGGKLNAVTLALSPLANADAARIISAVLDQALLPAETQEALLDRAGGNPLYAEQFARLFLESGSVDDVSVPENVQGIIAARLDGLSSDEKRVLQDAAVLGKVFWSGAVGSLSGSTGEELASLLHTLERKGFIRRERRSAVAGETELAFRHVLVREVAYGQIPRAARSDKHVAAVSWIESLGRLDDHAELVAHHYTTALALRDAAGTKPEQELVERARLALRRAADRAAALNAFAPAADHYRAALALWPSQDADRVVLEYGLARMEYHGGQSGGESLATAARSLLDSNRPELAAEAEGMAADAAWHDGREDEVEARMRRALTLVEPLPGSRTKAWLVSQASRYEMLASRNANAIEYGRRALEMAAELDLPEVRVHALTNVGVARFFEGDFAGRDDIREAIALATKINSPEVCRALHNLSTTSYLAGDLPAAGELSLQAIAAAERFGIAPVWRFSRSELPSFAFRAGRWDEALALIETLLSDQVLPALSEATAREFRAWILSARGEHEEADRDSARALDVGREAKIPQMIYPALSIRVRVLLNAGDREGALELMREIQELGSPKGFPFGGPPEIVDNWLSLVGPEGFLSFVGGREPTVRTPWVDAGLAFADGDFDRAIAIYEGTGALPDVAFVRLRAARSMVEAGRRAEADAYLHEALAFYRSVGARHYISEGEALLAASA
jgi:class 3 adenylate cyclase/tetratricopeptide (TPR) repeat protein